MADNQIPFIFEFQSRGLDIIKRAREEAERLVGALNKRAVLKGKLELEGTEEAERSLEQIGQKSEEVNKRIEESTTRRIRGTILQAEAFLASRAGLQKALATGKREDYQNIGVTGSLANDAKELDNLRQRLRILLEINRAVGSNKGAIERASSGTSYSFSSIGSDTKSLVYDYNKLVEEKFRFSPSIRPEELDFQAKNRRISLEQLIIKKQDRLALRAAISSGSIRGRSDLGERDLDQIIGTLHAKAGLPNYDDLVKTEISTQRNVLPRSTSENVYDRLTRAAQEGLISGQQLVMSMVDYINRTGKGGFIRKEDWMEPMEGSGGRGFNVFGNRKTPPIPTSPTIYELHQGITEQAIRRERERLGLPIGPGGSGGGGSGKPPGMAIVRYTPPGGLVPYSPPLGPPGGPIASPYNFRWWRYVNQQGGGPGGGGGYLPPMGGGPGGGAEGPGMGGFGGSGGRAGGFGAGGGLGKFGQRFQGLLYYSAAAAIIYPIASAIADTISRSVELEKILLRIQGIYGNHTLGDQLTIRKEILSAAREFNTDLIETARAAETLAQEQIPARDFGKTLKAVSAGNMAMGVSQEALINYAIAVRNARPGDREPIDASKAIELVAALTRQGGVSATNIMTTIQQVLPLLQDFAVNKSNIPDEALLGSMALNVSRRSGYTGSQVSNALRFSLARFQSPKTSHDIEKLAGSYLGTKESGGEELRPYISIMNDLATAYQHFLDTGQSAKAGELVRELFGPRQAGVGTILLREWVQVLEDATKAVDDHAAAEERAQIAERGWFALKNRTKTELTNIVQSDVNPLNFLKHQTGYWYDYWMNPQADLDFAGTHIGNAWTRKNEARDQRVSSIMSDNMALQQIFNPQAPVTSSNQAGSILQNAIRDMRNGVSYVDGRRVQLPSRKPGASNTTGILGDETQELYLNFSDMWKNWDTQWEQFGNLAAGQQQASRDLGAHFFSPKKNLQELRRQLETFYQTIRLDRRKPGQDVRSFIGTLGTLSPDIMTKYNELISLIGPAATAEGIRQRGVTDLTEGGRRGVAGRQSAYQTGLMQLRLERSFNKRAPGELLIEAQEQNLTELARERINSVDEENIAYVLKVKLLQQSSDFQSKEKAVQDAELYNLGEQHKTELQILALKYEQQEAEIKLNTLYQLRLKHLQEIESLAQEINSAIKGGLIGAPGQVRSRGVLGHILGSVLAPVSASLYGRAISQINLFGQGGLFPKIGEFFNKMVGEPSQYKSIQVPNMVNYGAGRFVQQGMKSQTVPKTAEEIRKDQIAVQVRAIEIAIGSTVGAAIGKGGIGAQVGSQLGAIGGQYLGKKLGEGIGGSAGTILLPGLGSIIGGIVGGLIGGLFDKHKKKPPELSALEVIARNTGEQLTLIENTNRLLELQNLSFNIPTGFTLPKFGPTSFGGQSIGSNGTTEINVEVNIGGTSSSPTQIGAVVAQAISERLDSEYRSGGTYVARTRY